MRKQWTQYSTLLQEDVWVHLEDHRNKLRIPYCDCSRCGKPVQRFYVVQSLKTDVEMLYLGTCCIKSLT